METEPKLTNGKIDYRAILRHVNALIKALKFIMDHPEGDFTEFTDKLTALEKYVQFFN